MRQTETKYAINLRRLMLSGNWRATPLSLAAGLSRTYVGDILKGKTRSPGSDALAKIANVLGCDTSEITGELADGEEPDEPDKASARRAAALRRTEKIVGDYANSDRHRVIMLTFPIVYEVMLEREKEGRPLPEDDDEAWRDIARTIRAWQRDNR